MFFCSSPVAKILLDKFWILCLSDKCLEDCFEEFILLGTIVDDKFVDALVALDILLEKLLFELLWIELFLYIIPEEALHV